MNLKEHVFFPYFLDRYTGGDRTAYPRENAHLASLEAAGIDMATQKEWILIHDPYALHRNPHLEDWGPAYHTQWHGYPARGVSYLSVQDDRKDYYAREFFCGAVAITHRPTEAVVWMHEYTGDLASLAQKKPEYRREIAIMIGLNRFGNIVRTWTSISRQIVPDVREFVGGEITEKHMITWQSTVAPALGVQSSIARVQPETPEMLAAGQERFAGPIGLTDLIVHRTRGAENRLTERFISQCEENFRASCTKGEPTPWSIEKIYDPLLIAIEQPR